MAELSATRAEERAAEALKRATLIEENEDLRNEAFGKELQQRAIRAKSRFNDKEDAEPPVTDHTPVNHGHASTDIGEEDPVTARQASIREAAGIAACRKWAEAKSKRALHAENALVDAKIAAEEAEAKIKAAEERAKTAEKLLAETQERAKAAEQQLAESQERIAALELRVSEAEESAAISEMALEEAERNEAEADERAEAAEEAEEELTEQLAQAEVTQQETEQSLREAELRADEAERKVRILVSSVAE